MGGTAPSRVTVLPRRAKPDVGIPFLPKPVVMTRGLPRAKALAMTFNSYTSCPPGRILSSIVTTFKPFPLSAERIMPQLSMPIILRGARFAT